MRFQQIVIETRTYEVVYAVEADNIEDAKNKIQLGETIDETEQKLIGVQQRDPYGELYNADTGDLHE